jgi:2-methylcitrate dehydratase PrpD
VVRAVALGYEVGGRLMTIFYRERHYTSRRFYHTAVAANMSSAVSAGVLLGLNRRALQVAMCLAAYQAAGPDNMTRAELEHKFRALVGPTFGAARTATLHRLLNEVETAASIRPLMQELHG